MRQQNDIHCDVIDGSDLLNGQLICENAANKIGQISAADKDLTGEKMRETVINQEHLPEPIDEKDDAQAFTSLILVVAVQLW